MLFDFKNWVKMVKMLIHSLFPFINFSQIKPGVTD